MPVELGTESGPAEDGPEEEDEDEEAVAAATTRIPPAVPMPRSHEMDGETRTGQATGTNSLGDRSVSKEVVVRKRKDNTKTGPLESSPGPMLQHRTPSAPFWYRSKPKNKRTPSNVSFVTAQEVLPGSSRPETVDEDEAPVGVDDGQDGDFLRTEARTDTPNDSRTPTLNNEDYSSSSPLLNNKGRANSERTVLSSNKPLGILDRMKSKVRSSDNETSPPEAYPTLVDGATRKQRTGSGTVRFDLSDDGGKKDRFVKTRLAQMSKRRGLKTFRRQHLENGEIIKVEKMLVRVEFTNHELGPDFDENDSQKIESRTLEKWKEFMVVCRQDEHEDYEFSLQLYKTRVIKAMEESAVKTRSAYVIPMNAKTTKVNLFSSLDKSIVLWEPVKGGSRIYIMRPRSAANSMEWFTFLRDLLGWKRPTSLRISVPDFHVNLVFDRPFDQLENSEQIVQAARGDEAALSRSLKDEEAAAGRIVQRCLDVLKGSEQWTDVVDIWSAPHLSELTQSPNHAISSVAGSMTRHCGAVNGNCSSAISDRPAQSSSQLWHQPVGLAWKRYDRLEWVHGANEKKMYGTIGMSKTHELELRPKQHYPTIVKDKAGFALVEPPPVEGFLIRLTSQRGTDQKLGRLFYKRLYFSTHNQHLVFNRPARSDPPPPPKLPMTEGRKIPNSREISEKIPLIYSVNPYQIQDGQVRWLQDTGPDAKDEVVDHDRDALDENERVHNLILKCDGYINLCNVVRVRKVQRGATPADNNVDEGSDVDFDQELDDEDTHQDDGATQEFDDDRTFELVLRNNLVVRLQAFDKRTKHEWMTRLRALAKYWTLRTAADTALYRSARQQNLALLHIDEEMEALMGQFARKWEIGTSYASPELYNMCGIARCRAVAMSGTLFRKPRLHASFVRSQVILCHGHLLVFRDALRSRSGRVLPHIQHERLTSIDLADCYVYSGLITDSDLLYTDRGPDTARSGHQGLPRMYREDGWSSTDEDTMTCFVLWHGRRTGWFRASGAGEDDDDGATRVGGVRARAGKAGRGLRRVSRLGVEGKSVVFKARSRAERDHWVMNLSMEIERLAQAEEVRIEV